MVKISILPQFQAVFTSNNYYSKYVGITINVVFPDTSELNFELWGLNPLSLMLGLIHISLNLYQLRLNLIKTIRPLI